MIFKPFLLNVNEANSYIVACEETSEAILIDVGDFDSPIEDFLYEMRLALISVFITHDHYDHTGGLSSLLERHSVPVYGGRGGLGGKHARKVRHGDLIRVGNIEGKVLATPGHTTDSMSITFPGIVCTGDALFSGSIGGVTSPQDGTVEVEHIRRNIFTLPDDYEIHPGHGPASTVEIERRSNPFFV
jgi:glyoxylase-like metal-dependent hydrolase (beta-lactamase superfamily II)